eukprot:989236-Rhodomonas_salina.1
MRCSVGRGSQLKRVTVTTCALQAEQLVHLESQDKSLTLGLSLRSLPASGSCQCLFASSGTTERGSPQLMHRRRVHVA